MKANHITLIISTLIIVFSCNIKSDQTSNETNERQDSTSANESESIENDSTKILVLKWKGVSTSEYGNWYEFVDEAGNDFHADRLTIPNFSEDVNEYFTRTPVEGTPFAQYEIKEAVKEKWFNVTIVTTQEENGTAGDGSMMNVITIVGIKPL